MMIVGPASMKIVVAAAMMLFSCNIIIKDLFAWNVI